MKRQSLFFNVCPSEAMGLFCPKECVKRCLELGPSCEGGTKMQWAALARKEEGECWAHSQPPPQHHTIRPAMQPQDGKLSSLVIKRPLQELEFLLVHMHVF